MSRPDTSSPKTVDNLDQHQADRELILLTCFRLVSSEAQDFLLNLSGPFVYTLPAKREEV